MKTTLGLLLSIAVLAVAACKGETPPAPNAETKQEAQKPMPPAAPTPAPAEGEKKK